MWIFSIKTMGILHVSHSDGSSHKKVMIGLLCHLNQSCWKLHEMNRCSLKFIPLYWSLGVGGLFCQLNQSSFILHQMNTSNLRFLSNLHNSGGGGAFLQDDPKQAGNNCYDLDLKPNIFPSSVALGGISTR